MTEDSLITAMVGRTLDNLYPKDSASRATCGWRRRTSMSSASLHDVSFQAHAGQITGFAGLVGAGRTETMRAVFGADKVDSGEIYIKGERYISAPPRTPSDIRSPS